MVGDVVGDLEGHNMTIMPVVTVTEIRGGIAAHAVEIGLAGHGRDQDRALSALRSVVGTWARCLAADGELERVIARLGVASIASDGGPEVVLTVGAVTN
jgi:hypothetical protein